MGAVKEASHAGRTHDVFDIAVDAFVALVDLCADRDICGVKDRLDDLAALFGGGVLFHDGLFEQGIPAFAGGLDHERGGAIARAVVAMADPIGHKKESFSAIAVVSPKQSILVDGVTVAFADADVDIVADCELKAEVRLFFAFF